MGDLFATTATTFVIVMFMVGFGTVLAILLSEILVKLKKNRNADKHKTTDEKEKWNTFTCNRYTSW